MMKMVILRHPTTGHRLGSYRHIMAPGEPSECPRDIIHVNPSSNRHIQTKCQRLGILDPWRASWLEKGCTVSS